MKAWTPCVSRALYFLEHDVDTDQIVPARFLRTASAEGFARCLFHDRRFDERGQPRADSPFHPPQYAGQSILVAGRNFGCGSSREHAVWALRDFGIRVIIALSFGEIFASNCLKNGLLPLSFSPEDHARLCKDRSLLEVDLEHLAVKSEITQYPITVDPFARFCLLHGLREIDYVLQNEPAIERFEAVAQKKLFRLQQLL